MSASRSLDKEIKKFNMQIDPEKIVDFSTQSGMPCYRVRWCDSWVQEGSLSHIWQHLIDNFWKTQSDQHNDASKYIQSSSSKFLPNFSSLLSNSYIPACSNDHVVNNAHHEARSAESHQTYVNTQPFNNSLHHVPDGNHQQPNGLIFNNDQMNINEQLPCNVQLTKNQPISALVSNDVFRQQQQQTNIGYAHSFALSVPDFHILSDGAVPVKDQVKEKVAPKSTNAKKTAGKTRVVRRIIPKVENNASQGDGVTCSICNRDFSRTVKPKKRLREHVRRMHLKNGKFKCSRCPKTFVCHQGLRDHEPVHSKERKHSCTYCKETFLRLSHLYIHLRTHEEEKNFRCEACFVTFNVQSELKDHCTSKHGSVTANVKCGVCKQNLYSSQSVYSHSLRHSGTRNFKCDVCGTTFKRKQILDQHKKRHDSDVTSRRRFQCDVCRKELTTKSSLREHMFLVHQKSLEETDHKCELCGKCFRNWANYNRHVKLHPKITGESNVASKQEAGFAEKYGKDGSHEFTCDICNENFSAVKPFLDHMKKHQSSTVDVASENMADLSCPTCSKSFTKLKYLRSHMQIHQSIELKCDVCSMLFKRRDTLRMHIKRHLLRNETAETYGRVAGEVYNCRRELRRKIGKPDKDGRVTCPCCDKIFNTRKLLLAHIVLHGEFSYTCDICEKTYKQRSCLNKHRKSHENEKKRKKSNSDGKTKQVHESYLTRKKDKDSELTCPYCQQTGIPTEEWTSHVAVHENDPIHDKTKKNADKKDSTLGEQRNEENALACHFCGKSFLKLEPLRRHIEVIHADFIENNVIDSARDNVSLVHVEDNDTEVIDGTSFQCDECKKVFTSKKRLNGHKQTHNKTPSSCVMCSKIYMRRDSLSRHMIQVHGIRKWRRTSKTKIDEVSASKGDNVVREFVITAPMTSLPSANESERNRHSNNAEMVTNLTVIETNDMTVEQNVINMENFPVETKPK